MYSLATSNWMSVIVGQIPKGTCPGMHIGTHITVIPVVLYCYTYRAQPLAGCGPAQLQSAALSSDVHSRITKIGEPYTP